MWLNKNKNQNHSSVLLFIKVAPNPGEKRFLVGASRRQRRDRAGSPTVVVVADFCVLSYCELV